MRRCPHCHRTLAGHSSWSLAKCRVCIYILDRLHESSTYRSLIGFVTAVTALTGHQMQVSAETQVAIISVGMTLAGLVGVGVRDQLHRKRRR